VVPPTF